MSAHDIEISAFAWVPDFARGYVRDLRIRWALEEAGFDYRTRLLGQGDADAEEYRAWQPFGQVPAYRDGTVELFESGAILLHLSKISDRLKPWDAAEEARISAWVLAALNSVEPYVANLIAPPLFHAGEPWVDGMLVHSERLASGRFRSLAAYLDGRDWLADRFSVADIVMATVLRDAEQTSVFSAEQVLVDYLARSTARPAFQRALDAQLADFAKNAA